MSVEDFSFCHEFGQGHLAKYSSEVDPASRLAYIQELKNINFKQISEKILPCIGVQSQKKDIAPIEPFPFNRTGDTASSDGDKWWDLGLKAASEGLVGAILLAGGQGSRLGLDKPKGMLDIGLPSKKSLFQLQAERILKIYVLAKRINSNCKSIPWYIMTSEATIEATKDFFHHNNFFGLSEDDVYFFEQPVCPCISSDGKIIMCGKNHVAYAPNGNGGVFEALLSSGALVNIKSRGLKYLHIYGVDNVLVRVLDPVFIGFCIEGQYDFTFKVVEKTSPEEPVGVLCMCEGRNKVLEYCELSHGEKHMRDESTGQLVFSAGNICSHIVTYKALYEASTIYSLDLPYHLVLKKIPYIDEEGNLVNPVKPNGYKPEKFIFDVVPFFERVGTLKVCRTDEFSPVKNPDSVGEACPSTAKQALIDFHTKLLLRHARIKSQNEPVLVELSPHLTYAGEGLEFLDGFEVDNSRPLCL